MVCLFKIERFPKNLPGQDFLLEVYCHPPGLRICYKLTECLGIRVQPPARTALAARRGVQISVLKDGTQKIYHKLVSYRDIEYLGRAIISHLA